ncbi:MAG TPA: hypothetical protein VK658_14245 [Chryseolinea sp.]|nr:hypothetical protein [Chryseolinea sp.]
MRTSLIVLSISFIANFFLGAQNLPPILKAVKPKRGIYTTFDEFLEKGEQILGGM